MDSVPVPSKFVSIYVRARAYLVGLLGADKPAAAWGGEAAAGDEINVAGQVELTDFYFFIQP